MELVIYVDGTPEDWFHDDLGTRTHTVALICTWDIDRLNQQIQHYAARVPRGLRQWKLIGGKAKRKRALLNAFVGTWDSRDAWVNVVSFEERTVAESVNFLCRYFGERGISFALTPEGNWCHSYVDICGHHELKDKPKKLLPLLFLSWLIGDLVTFYTNRICANFPGERVDISVCLNHLSGDGTDFKGLKLLRQLLAYSNIRVDTLSLKESRQLLMADNLAGVFHQCLIDHDWAAALGKVGSSRPFTWMRYTGVIDDQVVWTPLP